MLAQQLHEHKLWLTNPNEGKRLVLQGVDLSTVDLRHADLRRAVLCNVRLIGADLSHANLAKADLTGANLSYAGLRSTNLRYACLRHAIMLGTILDNADLTNAFLPDYNLVPETGAFIAWKKVMGDIILQLQIPANAKRTSALVGRMGRASQAKPLKAFYLDGREVKRQTQFYSRYNPEFVYELNKTISEPGYNDDIRTDACPGIHFFMSRKEAEQF